MQAKLKIAILFIFSIGLQTQFVSAQKKVAISIQNNSNEIFSERVISVPWKDIINKFPSIDTAKFVVINSVTKKDIPFQLEYMGKSTVQNLLIQADVQPKSLLQIYIKKGSHQKLLQKHIAVMCQNVKMILPGKMTE